MPIARWPALSATAPRTAIDPLWRPRRAMITRGLLCTPCNPGGPQGSIVIRPHGFELSSLFDGYRIDRSMGGSGSGIGR